MALTVVPNSIKVENRSRNVKNGASSQAKPWRDRPVFYKVKQFSTKASLGLSLKLEAHGINAKEGT